MRVSSDALLSMAPCQSSPSVQATPVTKRSHRRVRGTAPVPGSIWWIFRSPFCPTQSVPSAQASPESPPLLMSLVDAPPWLKLVADRQPAFRRA
jgi:hypothetical protein